MTWGPRASLQSSVPVDPDAEEAQELLRRELSEQQYQAAQPTWFDRLVSAFWDWVNSLQFAGVEGPSALWTLIAVVLAAVAIVLAFLIFGLPRLNRRSAAAGTLFGDDDTRRAAELRASAERAAAAGDWSTAIVELFRAIARDLEERTIVESFPGTTASGFARNAADAFPSFAEGLAWSATVFDGVRYLGRAGNQAQYEAVAALERDLRTARPVGAPAVPA